MRTERIRARQLRARFTATLLSNLIRSAFSTHVRSIINWIIVEVLPERCNILHLSGFTTFNQAPALVNKLLK